MNEEYGKKYLNQRMKPFSMEVYLDTVRRKKIIEAIRHYHAKSILDVGCGPYPLFNYLDDFDDYTTFEPIKVFYENAIKLKSLFPNKRVEIYYGKIEENGTLLRKRYDIVIISSLLHEVSNPTDILDIVKRISDQKTIVIANVPNVNSFHRLLAVKSGIITSQYEDSETDKLYQRSRHFSVDEFKKFFIQNGFSIIRAYTYFIKIFSNSQMEELLELGLINNNILSGLEYLSELLPDVGAEIYLEAKISEY
ncbi:MAG: class I SAM-dependent methyltransferase [Conexivisphaerales archaeon]